MTADDDHGLSATIDTGRRRRRGQRRQYVSVENDGYKDIITVEPGKRGGKPTIRGLRITVYDVLSYMASGMSPDEILADFPELTSEDILACLSYAADRERRLVVARSPEA